MRTFVDGNGRSWTIVINVSAIKRLRGLIQVDLYGLVTDGFAGLGKLLADPVSLVDVIYCLCKDEADARDISDEDFGRAMFGDTIKSASDAFLEELTDFFPDPRVRAGLRQTIATGAKVRDHLMDQVEAELAKIDPASEARKLMGLSGDAPESSG